jgi:hypothetical protein
MITFLGSSLDRSRCSFSGLSCWPKDYPCPRPRREIELPTSAGPGAEIGSIVLQLNQRNPRWKYNRKSREAMTVTIPPTAGMLEKADAWVKTEISFLISILYVGRGGGIRTPDPLLPKQMRYQTALRPDACSMH